MSTSKIISFTLFFCAAIIASLFVFHLRHKSLPAPIATNEMTVFSIPRDLKPFELVTTDNKKFTQKDFLNHWTLLFFGFTHCSNVCPTTLDMMNRAYNKLHASYPSLQVVLISLDPERDTPMTLTNYMHSFNNDFIGVTGKITDLRKLQSQLGIFSARDSSSSENNYQIQHTSSIILINPQGKWTGLFKYGLTPEQFAKNFEESVKSFS